MDKKMSDLMKSYGIVDFKTEVASVEQAYFDSQGNEVSKEEGCQARITEFDADGNIIREVWGSYTPEKKIR